MDMVLCKFFELSRLLTKPTLILRRMPTAGLLDKPQDAKFYDYHLQDAKDKPFATFNFHYRSWVTLISQQLIPADQPQHLLMSSPSILSLNGNPKEFQGEVLSLYNLKL